ncbi:MAG TPA: YcnI family protein [Paenirhodobacter sp.]
MTAKIRIMVAGLALAAPMPLAAHIHLGPETATRGATAQIGLIVGHGCAGQATTALRVAIPPGLTDVTPVAKPGWQVASTAGEILWQGGSLADGVKDRFVLQATIRPDAPETIAVPVIQICGATQTRWIDADPNADSPAPVLRITPKQ